MTLLQIQLELAKGTAVFWGSLSYEIKDLNGMLWCVSGGHTVPANENFVNFNECFTINN